MSALDASVVVPVRDGAASLPPLLRSLDEQTLARDRFEIIVVDNASRDDTASRAREGGAIVVEEPVANRSRARNAGIAVARADLVAFTDADCIAEPGWLEALVACRDRAPLVAGHVVTTTSPTPTAIERFEERWRFGQEAWVRQGWAATANLAVRRDVLEEIGGFDPAYRHIAEDADLCVRAGRAGHALAFCAGAVVRHAAERSLEPLLRRAFRHGYGSHQALGRLGLGHRAWSDPLPLVSGAAALRMHGVDPAALPRGERLRLGLLARSAYAARVVGSVWAQAQIR